MLIEFSVKNFLSFKEKVTLSLEKENGNENAILMVRNSNMISLGGKWDILKQFLFSEDTNNSPSEFEFTFIANKI